MTEAKRNRARKGRGLDAPPAEPAPVPDQEAEPPVPGSVRRIREVQAALEADNATRGPELLLVPRDEWPPTDPALTGPLPLWVFRSNRFLVLAYRERAGMVRLTIQRTSLWPTGEWADGITWDELQAVKDAVGLGDFDAAELYPRTRDVVNVANMRHLWVLPTGATFAWRKGTASAVPDTSWQSHQDVAAALTAAHGPAARGNS